MRCFTKTTAARRPVQVVFLLTVFVLLASSCGSANAEPTINANEAQSTSTTIADLGPDSLPMAGEDTFAPISTQPVNDAQTEAEGETSHDETDVVVGDAGVIPEAQEDLAAASPLTLGPEHAQLGQLEAWNTVDTWDAVAFGGAQSADCQALNDVLALEDRGVITKFWLQDGTELYQHTAELDNADAATAYLRAVAALGDCGQSDLSGSTVTARSFDMDPFTGVTLDVSDSAAASWLFEAGTRSSSVIVSRDNVVSILQVVPTKRYHMAEFEALAHQALEAIDSLK